MIGGESKNFESFQEYPSFDNGILDLEPVIPETVNPVIQDSGTMNSGTINSEFVYPGTMNSEFENPTTMNSGTTYAGIENPTTMDSGTMNQEFVNPVIMSAETMDNGILDIGMMDSGSMNTETINPGIGDPATINSGTANSEFVNPTTVNSGNVNSEFVNPATVNSGTVNSEFVNPGTMDSGSMQSRAINSQTTNTEIPVQQSFDPGIPETSNNYEKAIVPGTIDSRSFTHTEAEWQRIQAGEPTVDYVDSTDSWDNYREDKPRSFFRTLLAFFVSVIVAGIFVLINVMFYDIEYISTLQFLLSILPPISLFCCFGIMTGKRDIIVVEGLLLIVLNEILSYIMFHSVMALNMKKIYPEFSFMEAWEFVNIMKAISETQRIFYLHFAIIFGSASVIGIIFGVSAIKGVLFDEYNGRRHRY